MRALRLTVAAVAAYIAAHHLTDDRQPITAALTALLIVQVTFFGTITDSARRVLSVLVGVGIAIAASTLVGLTWWSLGTIVLVSILVGQALRLGPHLLEVPISAMLILAAGGGAGVRAFDRVAETLIGAAVGLLVTVLVPQRPRTRSAGVAVERFGDSIATLLDRVSSSLWDGPVSRDEALAWLDGLRSRTSRVEQVERELDEASESRRLNPRAVGLPDTTPDLRSGLQALEHAAVALRAVLRSLADGGGVTDEAQPDGSGDEALREALAVLMSDLARAVRDFGTLVRAEGDEASEVHTAELEDALDAVREARVRLTELLLVDPRDAVGLWQLRGSLLAGVERVLAELDAEERRRRTAQRRQEAEAARRPAERAAERLRTTTRRVVAEAPSLRRQQQQRRPRR